MEHLPGMDMDKIRVFLFPDPTKLPYGRVKAEFSICISLYFLYIHSYGEK